jgi:DNA-directed RNA polymerase subunit K/omega
MEAAKRISNPFLLCSVISKRALQLMSGGGNWTTQEIVSYALNELLAGGLEFKPSPNLSVSRKGRGDGVELERKKMPPAVHALCVPSDVMKEAITE